MKKTSLALALLGAFAGAASAQTVTLYGRASVTAVAESGGDRSLLGDDTIYRLRDGGEATGKGGSRWGLRVKEDLGGGLSANAVLESGFNLDDGTSRQGGRLFGRQAYVGLDHKSLGEIRLGRHLTATRGVLNEIDPSGNGELKLYASRAISAGTGFTSPGTGALVLFTDLGGRVDNSLTYLSPKWGGLQVIGQVGAGEGPTAARYQSLALAYGAGRLRLGLSYEAYDGFGETYNETITFGGNIDIGIARLHAGVQRTSDAGTQTAIFGASQNFNDRNAYLVGAVVPLGRAELKVSYASSDFERDGGNYAGTSSNELDLTKLGVSLHYNLSKRTSVFTGANLYGGDLDDYLVVKRELMLFGLAHAF
jgi:GBP family porin